ILTAFAMPQLGSLRSAMSFESASEEIAATLSRARWLAITSGRPATTVELTSPTVVSVRNGGALLASSDVADYGVTLSATDFPFTFDSRGFVAGSTPTITITSSEVPASTTLTVGPLGKVDRT
ncbi:MAG: pilus assembly FimT family protein, partial [Candidatus Binatia bacterium]